MLFDFNKCSFQMTDLAFSSAFESVHWYKRKETKTETIWFCMQKSWVLHLRLWNFDRNSFSAPLGRSQPPIGRYDGADYPIVALNLAGWAFW